MASNYFGNIFRITTWGESHGKGIGVVIDGCPAGLAVSEEEINCVLARRAPGQNPYTTPRKESDRAEILSGVFEGFTTGAPVALWIANQDQDSSKYEPIKDLLRPGHANFTYLEKYGIFDYRGGGRASARETAGRVAAGAIAKKFLQHYNIRLCTYLKQVGKVRALVDPSRLENCKTAIAESPIFCPNAAAAEEMMKQIELAKQNGDSLGGIVECSVYNLPVGLGDPVYQKLEANLAAAMMGLPATKGFEVGSGFLGAELPGSEHNDPFVVQENGKIGTSSNHAGGVLAGISTGMPLLFRVAFKPPSSIPQPQQTLNISGKPDQFNLPQGSRHDPCVAIRAVPVVEAMSALVLADAILMQRCARL